MVGIIRSPLGCCQCTEGQNIVWRYHFVIMTASVWAWERAATMGVGAGLPAIRRCGLSATARCAPRRQTHSHRGSGQQRCDGCGSWLASDSDAAVCQRQPGAPPQTSPLPEGGGQQRWAWELACQRLDAAVCQRQPGAPPADEPAPRGGAGSKDALGVGAGLPAIQTLRFVSDSPLIRSRTNPLPQGVTAATTDS